MALLEAVCIEVAVHCDTIMFVFFSGSWRKAAKSYRAGHQTLIKDGQMFFASCFDSQA